MKPNKTASTCKQLFLVSIFALLLPFAYAQPGNDACANATNLPCGTTNLAGTTVGAVSETSPGVCVGNYGVWYSFTGNGVSNTISATSPMDIGMRILSGSCGALTGVTCQDGPAAGGTETYTFTPANGVTYYVYIAYWSTGSTTNTFTITRTCAIPPSNDACINATPLPCGTNSLAGTTVAAVSETIPPNCGGYINNYGVWYSFIGDGNNTTITVQETGGFDTGVGIYSGTCGSLTKLYCLDAVGATNPEIQSFNTTSGVTYFIYVSYFSTGSNTQGTFTISRTCIAPPSNDACANATPLPCGTSSLAGTTVGAVSETAPPNCGSEINNYGVWYSFIGDGNNTTITVQETGGFDTGVGIYSGSCGSLTKLYCLDAVGASNPEIQSFNTVNGTTYFIYVSYFDNTANVQGTFTISRVCTAPSSQDCAGAMQVCDDQTMSGNSNGYGIQEINTSNYGCLAGGTSEDEDESSWYYFQATTSGTLEFILTPSDPNVDYDFLIWGPNADCNSLGNPIRCNASGANGVTGMVTLNPSTSAAVTNTTSNPGGTSTWIKSLQVNAGEMYIMMINNFTANSTPFTLDWTFSVPNLLNCNPIPLSVELKDFTGMFIGEGNQLIWSTFAENNNAYFTLESSIDAQNWQKLSEQSGAAQSNEMISYEFIDRKFSKNMINYYRLSQTDFDGTTKSLGMISINNTINGKKIKAKYNTLGQIVDDHYQGFIIIEYTDGTTIKKYQ